MDPDTIICKPKIIDRTEEEEILVYADFDSVLDNDMFQNNSLFKIIDIDSDEPFLQIGTQMYSGKWIDTVGTQLFFEPALTSPPQDPVFSDVPNCLLNYKFKTRKCLELSRVFINNKHSGKSGYSDQNDVKENVNSKRSGAAESMDNSDLKSLTVENQHILPKA